MKKLLPASFILTLFLLAACKKDSATKHDPKTQDTVSILQPAISVSAVSPSTVTEGTIATITGTNLGTGTDGLAVYFQGVAATIQSVSATEIKVNVPQTTSGDITFKINGKVAQASTALSFTYYTPIVISPYVSGDVILNSQADVDAFVKANKGKHFEITGKLAIGTDVFGASSDINLLAGLTDMITGVTGMVSISAVNMDSAPFLKNITVAGGLSVTGCSFTTLDISDLQNFSGDIILRDLGNLATLKISTLTKVDNLQLKNCPLLADLSFLSSLQTAGAISLISLGNDKISLDNLTSVTSGGIEIGFDNKLSSLSFKSLTAVTGQLYIHFCMKLTNVFFSNLKSVSGRLTLFMTNLNDLSGFSAVQSLGALNVSYNTVFTSLHGMEQLTKLTMPAINGTVISGGGPGSIGYLSGLPAALGGVAIVNNPELASLSGLQNVTSLPLIYILNNKTLNDFCPFKTSITAVSALKNFDYSYIDIPGGMTYTHTMPALYLVLNGGYTGTQTALDAVALCH